MTARVHHADLWGGRPKKYDWLNHHDVTDTHWKNVQPQQPLYLFKPQKRALLKEYNAWPSIAEAMPVNNVGVVTGQDNRTIALEEHAARELAGALKLPPACIRPILYRPFDTRFIVYDPSVVTRSRTDVMRHLLAGENLGMICTRQTRDMWDVHATRAICGHKSCSAYDINTLFPLYLYPNGELIHSSIWPPGKDGRRPNLTPEFVKDCSGKLGLEFIPDGMGDLKKTFGPEDVLHYAYAVFHSPTYRSRYAEYLKIDFPRLPLTADKALFARLCGLGAELVGLHLLENVPAPAASYPRQGDNVVQRVAYKPPTDESPGRVCINDKQYFDSVPPEVFDFHVGGYRVCEKWLKDHKGRALSYDDIEHYRLITEAARQTLRLMKEIDRSIPSWPLA
jgi:predicted helicase